MFLTWLHSAYMGWVPDVWSADLSRPTVERGHLATKNRTTRVITDQLEFLIRADLYIPNKDV